MDYFKTYAAAGNACLAAEEAMDRRSALIDKAIADAWEDSNKLADACDAAAVQYWLRRIRWECSIDSRSSSAKELVGAIESAFIADPMFDTWVQDAQQEISP